MIISRKFICCQCGGLDVFETLDGAGGVRQRARNDEPSRIRVLAAAFCPSRNILEQDIRTNRLSSVNSAFLPPGSINRVLASTGVTAAAASLSGGR